MAAKTCKFSCKNCKQTAVTRFFCFRALIGDYLLKSCQPLIDVTHDALSNSLTFAFEHIKSSVDMIAKLNQKLMFTLANSIEFSNDVNTGEYIKMTVHLFRDGLESWRQVYAQIKDYLAFIPVQVGSELDADVHAFFKELRQYLNKFKAINQALDFFWEYQSWFEEFHLSTHVEEVTRDVRR